MNLVKWFRRNNKKVMAVVVIVIMIGFIGGSALTSLLQRDTGMRNIKAYLGDDTKIRDEDLYSARRELDILKMLRADALLKSQDMQGLLLGELLFADRTASATLINRLKQTIRQNRFEISDKQLNAMYGRIAPPAIYWYCLRYEAESAGISLGNDEVARLLGQIIPQLFDGGSYSQVVGAIMSQSRITEETILATLGKLLAVLQYAHMTCSSEDVTTPQIMHTVSTEQEGVDVGYVRFDAAVFAEKLDKPDNGKMAAQFDKYKDFFAGQVSDDNPYGFGYKLPDRVRLEYIAIKLDDVRTIVTPPTQDQMGDYYNRNKEQSFTEQVRSDPNDPNSLTERVKGYAEVVDTIEKEIMKSKILSKAETILQQARTITEAGLEDVDETEIAALSADEFRKKLGDSGDYQKAAQQLSQEHGIKVYAGLTGTLGPLELQTDEHLRTLVVRGSGGNPVMLRQIVFAVDELEAIELGRFDAPKPRMYENIGPVRDWMTEYGDASGTIMAVLRVVEASNASAPTSVDQSFSTSSFVFDPNDQEADEDVYSVEEKVAEDVKKLAVMDTAKARAEDFIAQAVKSGWQTTIENFNKSHKEQYEQDANDPDPFRMQNSGDMRRMSAADLDMLALHNQGNPAGAFYLRDSERNKRFVDQLYSLVPRDKTTSDALPLVVEVKPDMSYYAIKSISVKRLWKEDYEKAKVARLYDEDYIRSQSLGAVHFNPENVLKRLKVRWAQADEDSADANTPEESEAAS